MNTSRVHVLVVTYGDRWKFLSRVLEALLKEKEVVKIIVIDNASEGREEIMHMAEEREGRIIVLSQKENLGSAGGYAVGISYARKQDLDFLLLLDDDNVPESGVIKKYINAYKQHGGGKIIIGGNRISLKGSQEVFEGSVEIKKTFTFFSVFSVNKLIRFLSLLFSKNTKKVRYAAVQKDFIEIFAFGYGGAFIPRIAIIEAPLPDAKLFTYGDDMEYSWGLIKLGYRCFLEKNIAIKDIDLTFSQNDKISHLMDLFMSDITDSKVFYRMRNAAYISRKHTHQSTIVLALSITIWYSGLLLLFILRKRRFDTFQVRRAKLIAGALYLGFGGNLEKFKENNQ